MLGMSLVSRILPWHFCPFYYNLPHRYSSVVQISGVLPPIPDSNPNVKGLEGCKLFKEIWTRAMNQLPRFRRCSSRSSSCRTC